MHILMYLSKDLSSGRDLCADTYAEMRVSFNL